MIVKVAYNIEIKDLKNVVSVKLPKILLFNHCLLVVTEIFSGLHQGKQVTRCTAHVPNELQGLTVRQMSLVEMVQTFCRDGLRIKCSVL